MIAAFGLTLAGRAPAQTFTNRHNFLGWPGNDGANPQAGLAPDVTLPLSQWTPIASNVLSTSGNFTITVSNTVSPGVSQRFYILQTQ